MPYKAMPVYVADVTIGAGLDKSHRYNSDRFAIFVEIFAFDELSPRYKRTGAIFFALKLYALINLCKKPMGKGEGSDTDTAIAYFFFVNGWSFELNRGNFKHFLTNVSGKALFDNWFTVFCSPVI